MQGTNLRNRVGEELEEAFRGVVPGAAPSGILVAIPDSKNNVLMVLKFL